MMNGTLTMQVALMALGIGWGDEVIVPAATFAATAYAPMAAGALPVIVDVLRIMAIADHHGLAVVEDAAHSHGKRWRDKGAGTFGAFGSFSHQNSKILTAGEGGTLTTEDDRLAELATSIIDCGRAKDADGQRYTFGGNYRMTELQAVLLASQLANFEAQMAERQENCAHFERLIVDAAIPGIRMLEIDARMTRRSFYRYYFAIEAEAFGGASNDIVSRALRAEGVACGIGYPGLNRDPLFQPSLSRLPVAIEHSDRLDVSRMLFPVSDLAAQQSVFLQENVFRAKRKGIEDALEAIAKVQRLVGDSKSALQAAVGV